MYQKMWGTDITGDSLQEEREVSKAVSRISEEGYEELVGFDSEVQHSMVQAGASRTWMALLDSVIQGPRIMVTWVLECNFHVYHGGSISN